MKKGVILALMLLSFLFSYNQITISGKVIDEQTKLPIEFATISLIALLDSTVSRETASDKRGNFIIPNVPPGNYMIRCSFIGFGKTQTKAFQLLPDRPKYSVATIELINANKDLSNVTVVGRRSILNTSIDRKVYNVEQDIMSRSGSASDILKNIPSVEVDIEGNVALRGSGDVIILINGKPSPLMGRTKAEVLQQLPANSIERIEVITNPSARYRPDGAAGIINIVLKKNIKNGFNGSATLNAGNKGRYNGNVVLNYKPKHFNLFGSYSHRYDFRKRFDTVNRTYLDSATASPASYYNQYTSSSAHPVSDMITLGIDYDIDKRNSFGLSATSFQRKQTRNDSVNNLSFNIQNELIQNNDRLRFDPESESEQNIRMYYALQFAKEGHEIRIEFNNSTEKEGEDNHYTNIYKLPSVQISRDNLKNTENTHQNQLTVDYTNPLSENSKLEAGYDGLYNRLDMNLYCEYFDKTLNQFVKDVEKSNRFLYNEDVHALYATYQEAFKKFGYQLGLRSEGVFSKGHLVTLDSFINRSNFKIYPTVHLSYLLRENNELQLNYSKRVHRPEAWDLNPFPEYQDPRNLHAGNPDLLPEIIHSIEFGYKWQNNSFSFVPGIYYRFKTSGFTSVIIPLNDTTLLSTTQNLSKDRSAGLELIFSAKAGKWFNSSLSTNIFHNQIDASNLGYLTNRSIYSMSANLNINFIIRNNTMVQVSSNYRSARLTAQGKNYPTIAVNTGVRQDFLKKKLSATLTISDLLNSLKQKSTTTTYYLDQLSTGRRDGLVVYLGISYRFGIIQKQKEEKLQFDNAL